MTADQRDLYMQRFTGEMEAEPDPLQPKPHHVICPEMRLTRQAVKKDARLGLFFHSAHPGIIEVQDGNAFRSRRQRLHQLRFAACDGFL